MVGTTRISNPVGVTDQILTLITILASLPSGVVSFPPVANIPTTPKTTLAIVGDPTPPYLPSFMLPLITRDYPYGMPTSMMTGLQSHASTYADNDVTTGSPLNPYLASGSAISNTG